MLTISNTKTIFYVVLYFLLRDEIYPDLVFVNTRSSSLNNNRLLIYSFSLQYYLRYDRGILAIRSRGAITTAFLFSIIAVEVIELITSLPKVYY
jgi:hypothetical protein